MTVQSIFFAIHSHSLFPIIQVRYLTAFLILFNSFLLFVCSVFAKDNDSTMDEASNRFKRIKYISLVLNCSVFFVFLLWLDVWLELDSCYGILSIQYDFVFVGVHAASWVSNEVGEPAELKHLNRRRKRN